MERLTKGGRARPRRAGLAAACAAALAVAGAFAPASCTSAAAKGAASRPAPAAARAAGPRPRSVMEIDRYSAMLERTPVRVEVAPLEPATVPPPAEEPLPEIKQEGRTAPHGGGALNGRVLAKLAPGRFVERWQAPMEPGLVAREVLYAGDRIALDGMAWQLFDRAGVRVARGPGIAPALLDPVEKLLLVGDGPGDVAAFSLQTAEKAFGTQALFADRYAHALLALRGRQLVRLGHERPQPPEAKVNPIHSIVEVRDLGDPLEVELEVLLSARPVGVLRFDRPGMLVAAGEVLVAAAEDLLVFIDRQLSVRGAFGGSFRPLALSLDGTGRAYVQVLGAEGEQVWAVTPQGKRAWAAEVSAGAAGPDRIPPLVGWDHRVFAISGEKATAIGVDGTPLWVHKAEAPIVGAVVTAEGELVLSAGDTVTAFDRAGKGRKLHRFEGEKLTTAPVPTWDGEILVASETALHCLKALRDPP